MKMKVVPIFVPEQNADLDFAKQIFKATIFSITSQKTCENAETHKKRGKIKKMKVLLDV